MKKLLITSIIVIFISCNNRDKFFPNYEGSYVLNRNPLDTLIIKNIKHDSGYIGWYHGEYERRVRRNDSLIIIQDELIYDSTMDALDFYNITIFEKPLDNTFGYHNEILDKGKNKKSSTSRFGTDILGKKHIYSDIKGFYYYKKID
ncbi:MAG: hypothetical protein ACRCUS_08005 [Anaerovoracaceae bacterium]